MREEKLLIAIGQVKEEFIAEAAPKAVENYECSKEKLHSEQEVLKVTEKAKNKRTYHWAKWGVLAAGLCIIAGLSIKTFILNSGSKTTSKNEQMEEHSFAEKNTSINYNTNVNNSAEVDTTNGDNAKTEALPATDTDVQTTDDAQNKQTLDQAFPNWGLTLSVKDVTSTGLTLVCTQSGGEPTGTLQTGEPYRLISLIDGTWKTVEELPLPEGVDGRAWNSLAYLIPMEDTIEFEINWNWMFGELPSGTYRLIKDFMDFRGTANYDTFDYWVEFEIQ